MDTRGYLDEIAKIEKKFSKLYQSATVNFGLPEGSMWVLYSLILSEEPVTQQDICEKMMFPKQTINSAVTSLHQKGYVELEKIDGSKRKHILLTAKGREFVESTVKRMLDAECRAVERMGNEKISEFLKLSNEFFECMGSEFQKEGIINA